LLWWNGKHAARKVKILRSFSITFKVSLLYVVLHNFLWRSLIELCTKTVDKFSNLFKSVGNLNTYSKICDETMTLDSGCSLQLVSIFHWCLSSEFQKVSIFKDLCKIIDLLEKDVWSSNLSCHKSINCKLQYCQKILQLGRPIFSVKQLFL